jgi:putative ABC transport system permease protein
LIGNIFCAVTFYLSAKARDVPNLVVGQRLELAVIGVGTGGALGLTRLMTGSLVGMSAIDPLTFVLIALLLTGVTLLAALVPARRVAKVDPMVALRCE